MYFFWEIKLLIPELDKQENEIHQNLMSTWLNVKNHIHKVILFNFFFFFAGLSIQQIHLENLNSI